MVKDKVLCVPFNGDLSLINEFIHRKDYIHEIYGTDNQILNGKPLLYPAKISNEAFVDTIEILRANDIKFNYLFNSPSKNYDSLTEDFIRKHLKFLLDNKIGYITFTEIGFMKYIREYEEENGPVTDTKFKGSVLQFVNHPRQVDVLWQEKYDTVLIDENIIHQIPKMRNLVKYIKSKGMRAEVLINNCCGSFCLSKLGHQAAITDIGKFKMKCEKLQNIGNLKYLFRCDLVPPKETSRYLDLGIDLLKLSSRDLESHLLISILDTYTDRDKLYKRPVDYGCIAILQQHQDFDDHYLEPFFEKIFSDECKGDCSVCDWCNNYAIEAEQKFFKEKRII
jgi:collagenase-like PrtC family protease